MSFRDLDEYLDPTLKLPIGGKTYSIQSPPAKTGLRVNALTAAARAVAAGESIAAGDLAALSLDDNQERDFFSSLLGESMDEMLEDDIEWHKVKHAALTTLFWVTRGRDAAEAYWQGGGDDPKAPPAPPKKRKKRRTPAAPPASPASSPDATTGSPGGSSSASTGS